MFLVDFECLVYDFNFIIERIKFLMLVDEEMLVIDIIIINDFVL